MLGATADVLRFEEAIAWFRARFPVTEQMAASLESWAGARAWTVAGAVHLSMVIESRAVILRAIEAGVPRLTLARQLEAVLTGFSRARLETVARTNVALSYNAGRYRQLEDPRLTALRPYRMYDSILDARTTDECRALDGVVLLHNHPFWRTHWPPLRHRCRSQVRSLSEREALRRGVTTEVPAAAPAHGFGSVDRLWEPEIPSDMADEWRRKRDVT